MFHLLLCFVLAATALPDCRVPPGGPVLGAFARCNVATQCDWCTRRHTTFDFLCCEGNEGFVSVHVLNPMVLYVFWQHAWAAFVYVVAIEIVEVGWTAMHGDLPVAIETDGFDESLSGLLLGAVLLCTSLGILLGYWLVRIFAVPGPLVSSDTRTTSISYRTLLVLAWLAAQLTVFITILGAWPAGFLWYTIVLATLLVIYAIVFSRDTDQNNAHIWGPASAYPVWKRVLFYLTFAAIVLVVNVPVLVGGGTWLANDWFIVAFCAGPVLVLLAVGTMIKECCCPTPARGAALRLWRDIFLFAIVIGVVLFAEHAIREPTGSGFVIAGSLFFFGGLVGTVVVLIVRSLDLTRRAKQPLAAADDVPAAPAAVLDLSVAGLRQRKPLRQSDRCVTFNLS